MYRQYFMRCGSLQTTGWIDTDAPLAVGQRLTTKEHGPTRIWTVRAVGTVQMKRPPDAKWRVGGLVER